MLGASRWSLGRAEECGSCESQSKERSGVWSVVGDRPEGGGSFVPQLSSRLAELLQSLDLLNIAFLKKLLLVDLSLPPLSALHLTLTFILSCLGLFSGHAGLL